MCRTLSASTVFNRYASGRLANKCCVAEQQTVELTATIDKQKKQLDQFEFKIRELLQALRGKQRERIDPSQLMLFDIGELESFIEEQLDDGAGAEGTNETEPSPKRKKKKRKRGRRLIPDHLPRVEIEHTLPADQRLCPHDGLPMPFIRWETSEQLDYIPGVMQVLVHKRAVYACPQKHDEARLITAPKPPLAITCPDIGSKISSRGTVSTFVAARFTTGAPASPKRFARCMSS